MAIEKPTYTILKKEGSIELREYASYLRASVTVRGSSHNNSGNNAFAILADYIFGNNTDTSQINMTVPVTTQQKNVSKKIAMTAPVTTAQTNGDTYEVSFIMPSQFTINIIPKPVNQAVTLHEVAKHRAAAIIFSGRSGQDAVEVKTTILHEWMAKANLVQVGAPLLARYDPPWKPGFIRTNEMIIIVK
jgi:hypothetical protein